MSDDVGRWVPGDLPFSGTKTKEQYMQVGGSIQQVFPDGVELVATVMIAEGNQVAVEGGKMVDVKEYMDTLHLLQLIQP